MSAINIFLSMVIKTDSCWIWTKGKTNGYGDMWADKKHWLAHRYSYTIHKGEIPKGMHILHSCDNRPCVNPSHLSLGTNLENIRDSQKKGRTRPEKYSSNGIPMSASKAKRPIICFNGHDLIIKENLYTDPSGRNYCRICNRLRKIKYRDKKQGKIT
jgi:hypothetical protein